MPKRGETPTYPALPRARIPELYAELLCADFDAWHETWNAQPKAGVYKELAALKTMAQAMNPNGKGGARTEIAGEVFQMLSRGHSAATPYVLENDDFQLCVCNEGMNWPVIVKATAGGLWEHGLDAIRARGEAAVRAIANIAAGDNCRPSLMHYAFDLYSPDFTKDMKPGISANVVAHAEVKRRQRLSLDEWGRIRVETLTIGNKRTLQVQAYDKGLEIDESSGKAFMLLRWERDAGFRPGDPGKVRDVWRVECRFGREYFRARSLDTHALVMQSVRDIVTDALYSRRLTKPRRADSNPRRWPLHPLWQLCVDAAGGTAPRPLGRVATGERATVADALLTQAAGLIRAAWRASGKLDEHIPEEFSRRVLTKLFNDPKHAEKNARADERYWLLGEAR